MSQLRKLSYSRLISRTTYYRDKALDLGKQVVVTKEKIAQLQNQLEKVQAEKKQLQEHLDQHSKEANDEYEQQVQTLQAENKQLTEQLEMTENKQEVDPAAIEQFERKIASYEELLRDIQQEITQKEKEANYYKLRAQNLEKRASYAQAAHTTADNRSAQAPTKEMGENKTAIISYFDYTVLWQAENKIVIRGDFQMKNISRETLKNPALCFRFSPPELANMKGKIISIEQASINKQTAQSHATDWMFLQSKGADEAKERGEIWVVPTEEVTLSPGETAALNEFQIPINTEFKSTLVVEGFVYFRDDALKAKAVNHIMISF